MSWLAYLEYAAWVWLAFAVYGAIGLYVGFGFAMSAVRARDDKLNPSSTLVVAVDVVLAFPIILLDGLYNAIVMPILCLDPRPSMAFRLVIFKGIPFPFFELVTERLSRYSEDANGWPPGRWWAAKLAPFLDAKDPKGWHIRTPLPSARRADSHDIIGTAEHPR